MLRARATNGRILPERLVLVSFEEVVTDHLWGYGPVLAIGDPQTKGKTAPLGAARDYATDSDWQDRVMELMQQASMVVVIAGQTKGLVWEIETVVSQGFLSKLVLLLPPVEWQEREARWRFLESSIPSLSLRSDIDLVPARAVIFPEGRATLICGDKRNDWTYEAVLDASGVVDSRRQAASPCHFTVTRHGNGPILQGARAGIIQLCAVGLSIFGNRNIHFCWLWGEPHSHPRVTSVCPSGQGTGRLYCGVHQGLQRRECRIV